MNYDLARQRITERVPLNQGLESGEMPYALLASKFEETDAGCTEQAYDDYARTTITNWGPDTNQFEHEGSRGRVTERSGRINLQYYGHRGTADYEKPEMFLGFGGPEDHDPRGMAQEPDMKKYVEQSRGRMRFQRFDSDMSEHVGSGNRSEQRVQRDNQTVFRTVRDRLKVFSRQLDGKRNGLRRVMPHKSDVKKQVFVQAYGDYVRDYALNPQRRANIVVGQLIRDSREWRDHTNDQDFEVVKYLSAARRAKRTTEKQARGVTTTEFSEEDLSQSYKSAGLLMSQLVRLKQIKMAGGDMAFAESGTATSAKSAPVAADLNLILRKISDDHKFGSTDDTRVSKNASPDAHVSTVKSTVYNHSTPIHQLLNAEVIYRVARNHGDLSKARDKIIRDSKDFRVTDKQAVAKAAKLRMKTGAKLAHSGDQDYGQHVNVMSYRKVKSQRAAAVARMHTGDGKGGESANTLDFHKNHTMLRANQADEMVHDMSFDDSGVKERLGGHFGKKYLNGMTVRDNREDSMAEESG